MCLLNLGIIGKCAFHRAPYLPLGAATGPTAQGLLCAKLREENRALHNTGGGADTLWLGTQVLAKDRYRYFQSSVSDGYISAAAVPTAPSWNFKRP